MKLSGNKLYVLLLAVFLGLVFVYQSRTPKKFVWQPTFSAYDRNPFGSYVFDDVLTSSIAGYQVVNRTFYQFCLETPDATEEEEPEDSVYDEETEPDTESLPEEPEREEEEAPVDVEPLPLHERRSILLTENRIDFTEVDLKAMQTLLKQGNRIMLCLASFPDLLLDTLCVAERSLHSFPFPYDMDTYVKEGYRRDSLYLGVDSLHPEQVCAVYPHLHPHYLLEGLHDQWESREDSLRHAHVRCDSLQVTVRNRDGQALVMRLFIGAGELFLVSTPLLFTNYGLLDGSNASYAFRLLSCLKDYPVVRTDAYGASHAQSESPLRYVLSRPPLRWAVYAAMITLLLCMFFMARRRQWVIPVVRPPANEMLRFTQLIGNLYYQRKDCKGLLSRKYLYFCNEVKQRSGFDLQSGEPDEMLHVWLAEKTGIDPAEIRPAFRELKYLLHEASHVSEEEMMRCIDRINEWRQRLK